VLVEVALEERHLALAVRAPVGDEHDELGRARLADRDLLPGERLTREDRRLQPDAGVDLGRR